MAAYAQFGYGGYPSATQLLSVNASQSPLQAAGVPVPDTPTQQSTGGNNNNTPALSPSTAGAASVPDCQANTPALGGAKSTSGGALSPDAMSQHSATAGGGGGGVPALVGGVPALSGTPGPLDSLAQSQLSVGVAAGPGAGNCCENGRPIMTDPVSGQTVCSCQYDSARLALSSYSRLPGASVYGTPYPSTDQNPYQSIGVDSSAFYTPLSNPYTLKDSTTGSEMTAWTSAGLQPTTGYYSYDPMSAYGYGASYDLAARRKNATRESTATLKAWLNEHKKNPYPTKGEKIMLAIITKMTLTQVSTWFANARRRLKKENKMTWEPKNRTDDDDDAIVSDDEKDKDEQEQAGEKQSVAVGGGGGIHPVGATMLGIDQRKDTRKDDDELGDEDQKPLAHHHVGDLRSAGLGFPGYHGGGMAGAGAMNMSAQHPHSYHPYHHQHPAYYQHQQAMLAASYHAGAGAPTTNNNNNGSMGQRNDNGEPKNQQSRDCGVPIPASKPKIWSLADTVACKTPPPIALPLPPSSGAAAAYMGQQQQQQLQLQHGNSSSSSMSNPSLMAMQQQQQQSHHMITNYGSMPYSRTPTTAYGTFLGSNGSRNPATHPLHAMSNTLYNLGSSNITTTTTINSSSNNNNTNSSSNSSGSHTPTTPIMGQPVPLQPLHNAPQMQPGLLRHQQQQQQQQHQQQQQRGMSVGFPETQPDTPPQTPPNMKVPNIMAAPGNLMIHTNTNTNTTTNHNHSHTHHHHQHHQHNNNNSSNNATPVHTTVTCRSSNMPPLSSCYTNGNPYAARYSNVAQYSPRDECSSSGSSSSCSSAGSPMLPANPHESTFKPLFKTQQISVAGFVPPV